MSASWIVQRAKRKDKNLEGHMSLHDEIQKFLLVGFKYDCLVFPIDQHPFILGSTVHSETFLTRQRQPTNGI